MNHKRSIDFDSTYLLSDMYIQYIERIYYETHTLFSISRLSYTKFYQT